MKKYTPILIALILFGCYSEKKANQQFSKATTAYPAIAANYCAITYPVKDTVIKGDTITTWDTLYLQGETFTDTLVTKDTVRITTIIKQPAKIITNTIYIKDTIIKENTAKLEACQLEKNTLLNLLKKKTDEADNLKHWRNIWMLIAIGLMLIDGVRLFFKIKSGSFLNLKSNIK